MKYLHTTLAWLVLAGLAAAQTSIGTVRPDGGGITPATQDPFLTKLGGSTAGKNLFRAATPTGLSYPRVGADGAATWRDIAGLKSDLNLSKVDVGLGAYPDNPSGLPVSSATQAALDSKIGWVNVMAFGANPNDLLDDTAAIQAAVNTGKSVYLPGGTANGGAYRINGTITVSHMQDFLQDPIGLGGQKIVGEGVNRTRIIQTTAGADCFRVTNVNTTWLQICDMTIEGPGGDVSTGSAITTVPGLYGLFEFKNVHIYWWRNGIYMQGGGNVTVDSIITNECENHLWFGAGEEGEGFNRNTIRHSSMLMSLNTKQVVNPATAITIESGQGWIIDGLDTGNTGMKTIIKIAGNCSGVVRGLSTEMFPLTGQAVSVFDGSANFASNWILEGNNFAGHGTMGANDWPVIKGVSTRLHLDNNNMSGWAAGKSMVKELMSNNTLFPLTFSGSTIQTADQWHVANNALWATYRQGGISTQGYAPFEAATGTNKGRLIAEFNRGTRDDALWISSQRKGSNQHGWDNLNAYNSDERDGRFSNIPLVLIDNGTVTATASSTSGGVNTPAKVLDNDDATYWDSGTAIAAGNTWLKFDLGAGKQAQLGRIRFYDFENGVTPLGVTVQGSNNDSTWTNVGSFGTRYPGENVSYLVNPEIAYRYYRLQFATTDASHFLAVKSVQLWKKRLAGEYDGALLRSYASNAAAVAGGLVTGDVYAGTDGILRRVEAVPSVLPGNFTTINGDGNAQIINGSYYVANSSYGYRVGPVGAGGFGGFTMLSDGVGYIFNNAGSAGRLNAQTAVFSGSNITINGSTLSVTGTSAINQDVSTGASPSWAGGTFTGGLNANSGLSVIGTATISSNLGVGASASLGWSARSRIYSSADGQVSLRNNANTADASLLFGGGTSSGALSITDTTNAGAGTGALTVGGGIYAGQNVRAGSTVQAGVSFALVGGSQIKTSGGILSVRNNADNDFAPLAVGSLTVTNPTTPASASATGTTGTIAWDAGYIYVCVAPNTWRRMPHTSW